MGININDISVVLSGGSGNADPNASLGGSPSNQPITGFLNNLFGNLSETDSQNGKIDYRCLYVFNDSSTSTLFSTRFFIVSQVAGGADLAVGVPLLPEIQKVFIDQAVTGGTLTLVFEGQNVTMIGNPNPDVMASSLQAAILPRVGGSGASVNYVLQNNEVILNVTFGPGRSLTLMAIQEDHLTGTSRQAFVQRVQAGGPINLIASPIDNELTTPTGVTFSKPSVDIPVVIGDLAPMDGFPVWVRRVILAGTEGVPDDGAVIRLVGKPFLA